MIKLTEMDDSVTLQQQLMTEAGPVVLINQFKVKPEESEQLIAAWTQDARAVSIVRRHLWPPIT